MNTKLVLGLLAAVVVLGGGYYYVQNSGGASSDDSMGADSTQTESGSFSGSFSDLSKRGGNWKCTIDAEANTGAGSVVSSGTVYVGGNKVRADFTSNVPSVGSVETHMIADGTDVYSWSSMMPSGFKMKQTEGEMGTGPGATSGQGVDANQSYAYDCDPWTGDQSVFAPPSNISFTSI